MSDKLWHKRHHDFEAFDRITFEIVPRYKESELSGDEWRQHIEVQFWFKNVPVYSFSAHDMQTAAMMLGHNLVHAASPIPEAVIKMENDFCDQPGCCEPPVWRYVLNKEYSRSDGVELKKHFGSYRQFCNRHKTRGDCGLEDSDTNYMKEQI